jgi:hypothetical protein
LLNRCIFPVILLSLTYCIAWLAQLYFRNYLVNGMIFEKKSHKYTFWFCLQALFGILS